MTYELCKTLQISKYQLLRHYIDDNNKKLYMCARIIGIKSFVEILLSSIYVFFIRN